MEHKTTDKLRIRFGVQKDIFKRITLTTVDYGATRSDKKTSTIDNGRTIGDELLVTTGFGIKLIKELEADFALQASAFNITALIMRASLKFPF